MNMKNKFSLLTIALFVCAQALWAEFRLVPPEKQEVVIEDTVPELSYSKWAYRQIPWIDRSKQNFPLVGK